MSKNRREFHHALQNGYYDDVIFHRIIKGFLDPNRRSVSDGTGGTSIWGSEFEDEINRDLRRSRRGFKWRNADQTRADAVFYHNRAYSLVGREALRVWKSEGMDIVNEEFEG